MTGAHSSGTPALRRPAKRVASCSSPAAAQRSGRRNSAIAPSVLERVLLPQRRPLPTVGKPAEFAGNRACVAAIRFVPAVIPKLEEFRAGSVTFVLNES
jgi:hypothetical protein